MPKIRKFFLAIFFLNFLTLVSGVSQSSLELKWKYSAPGEISALEVYDLNNDSYPEVIFASENKIYILDKAGIIKNNFTVFQESKTRKRITSIDIINKSPYLFVLGLGWMENFPVSESYFNETEVKEEVIYRKTLHQGEVKIFDNEGREVDSTAIGEWVRDITVKNLDSKGEEEIILCTGGLNTFYYERLPEEGNISVEENVTTETNISENRTYDVSFWQGSLMIFHQNFSLISEKSYPNQVVWGCQAADFYQDLDLEIIVVSSNQTSSLTRNLTLLWSYSPGGEVRYLWVGDLRNDKENKILIISVSPGFSTLQGLDRKGEVFLNFRTPTREEVRDFRVDNLDLEKAKEILIATDKNIYAFTAEGEPKFSYPLFGINYFQVEELDLNNYTDILVVAGNKLSDYEFPKVISLKREADNYYEKAEEFFLRNYSLAKEYAEKAKEIYMRINQTDGVIKTRKLISELDKKILNKKKAQADSFYAKAIALMASGSYNSSKEYAEKAKEVYSEINDFDGVNKCDKLIYDINKLLGRIETTTTPSSTTTPLLVTTTFFPTTLPSKPPQEINPFFIIPLVLLVFLALLLLIRRKMKGEEKKEKEELKI